MKALTVLDLTLAVEPGMLRFPGDPDPKFTTDEVAFGKDSTIVMSTLNLSVHVGTHVDAPGHFIKGGKMVSDLPVHLFVGNIHVIDFSDRSGYITRADLEQKKLVADCKLFIKTRNSELLNTADFQDDHTYLTPEAADYLVERGVKLLGFDYYNIDDSRSSSLVSHMTMAKAGVPVIVAINMSALVEGDYSFSAVPLALWGIEASPVRVVVWQE